MSPSVEGHPVLLVEPRQDLGEGLLDPPAEGRLRLAALGHGDGLALAALGNGGEDAEAQLGAGVVQKLVGLGKEGEGKGRKTQTNSRHGALVLGTIFCCVTLIVSPIQSLASYGYQLLQKQNDIQKV